MISAEEFNALGRHYLAARLGIFVARVSAEPACTLALRMPVRRGHLAPHDFLHGGAIAVLADTACGFGSLAMLPTDATGFLTVESKTNHLAAVRSGVLECVARARHAGRTTQVWDAEVTELASGRLVAMFRCTQMLLYANAGGGGNAPGTVSG